MSGKLRIGVIGAGRIGKLHANNLASRVPNAELAAISDVYEPAAKELAEKLNVPKYYSDYHKILEDPDIDAVFICSSTDTHSPISMEAAKAGKHIFCEKPIDHDLDKIRAVLEEVKKAGVKYQVGFNRRFDRNFKHVHDVVAEGGIGVGRWLDGRRLERLCRRFDLLGNIQVGRRLLLREDGGMNLAALRDGFRLGLGLLDVVQLAIRDQRYVFIGLDHSWFSLKSRARKGFGAGATRPSAGRARPTCFRSIRNRGDGPS